jgi:hypothetical protein
MSQTTYNIDPGAAKPGMLASDALDSTIITCIAHEDIPPGRFVALRSDGTVELPKSDTAKLLGVSMYVDTFQSTYPQGNAVVTAGKPFPVCRAGRIYASFTGSNQTNIGDLGAIRVCNDSATLATQGTVTDAAVAAGTVRRDVPGALIFRVDTTDPQYDATLAMLELDMIGLPQVQPETLANAVTGNKTAVTDANAKAVLTSIIAALVKANVATDSTT